MERDVILQIETLCLTNREGETLVDHISLTLHRGETLGLVGESGSGKTLTLKSLIGLLPSSVRQTHDVRQVDGNCAMIFQNPLSALDPLCPVFAQLTEIVMLRQNKTRAQAREIAGELIKKLSLPESLLTDDRYPGELSGGQCQRILIALALACRPDILLCDEPTGALDYQTGKSILKLLQDTGRKNGMTVIIITHNSALTDMADRVIRVKNGTIASVTLNDHPKDISEIEW